MKQNYAMVSKRTFSSLVDIRLAASAGGLEGGTGAVDLKLIAAIRVMPHVAVFSIYAFIICLTGTSISLTTILTRFHCIL